MKYSSIIDPSYPDPLIFFIDYLNSRKDALKLRPTALRFARRTKVLLPHDAKVLVYEGLILSNMGQKVEALSSFSLASDLDDTWAFPAKKAARLGLLLEQYDVARIYLSRWERLAPDDPEVLAAQDDHKNGTRSRSHPHRRRFPGLVTDFKNFEAVISHHLFADLGLPRVLRGNSKILATGSCFALNLASSLERHGYSVTVNGFAEEINSTLANLQYFEWLFSSDPSKFEISKIIPPERRHVSRSALLASDLIVLTVGVAPVFLGRETGKLRMRPKLDSGLRAHLEECEFRTLSVEENFTNLSKIISIIHQYRPKADIFLTLSPVPLNTTFEYTSAIMADCVSKSVLRVSIDLVMRLGLPHTYYWPAFEAVRWIGGYTGGAYGGDDNSAFHVSSNIVEKITSAFIDTIAIKPKDNQIMDL